MEQDTTKHEPGEAREEENAALDIGASPENPKPIVRDALTGDGAKLRAILEHWIKDRDTGTPLPEEVDSVIRAIEESTQELNAKKYVVAEDGEGNMAGVMGMTAPGDDMRQFTETSNPVEFINAYVDPSQRGAGLGKLLVQALEEKAVHDSYTEVVVNSGPRYEDYGWGFWTSVFGEPVAVQKDLYGPGGDAPVWKKLLSTTIK